MSLSVLEICGGAGGQALGLEQAGWEHAAIAEIDPDACNTLRANRPGWKVIEGDIRDLDGGQFDGVDLVAGGVPCPPFTVAGRQLGAGDERDLFPEALRIIEQAMPRAVMLENVPGLAQQRFYRYRESVLEWLGGIGYACRWNIARSHMFGVPQLRPRLILVAMRRPLPIPGHHDGRRVTLAEADGIPWPLSLAGSGPLASTVGEAIADLMSANGWPGVTAWADRANAIAPTIVGGSKKHGGADLGPTRAREAWRRLGVNGKGVADAAPGPDFPEGEMPKLTVRMVARIQGFPDEWQVTGRKTAAYRQVGNAFPPPVARAFGTAIREALAQQ
jgi:DNA (cytosine-5)-methyltransferase 1